MQIFYFKNITGKKRNSVILEKKISYFRKRKILEPHYEY